ncbi:MAG TPA: hypothetical protein VIY28_17520 [Pseudonocardiaceae bacterium]
MRRSSEPDERAQFSVAELLARHGEPAPPATGRRRRRAPEVDDTAAQSIIERVKTDSGPLPVQQPYRRRGLSEPGHQGLGGAGRSERSDGPATEQFPRLDPIPRDPVPWEAAVSRDPVRPEPRQSAPVPPGGFPGRSEPPAGLSNGTRSNGTRTELRNGILAVEDQKVSGVRAGDNAGRTRVATKEVAGEIAGEQPDSAETQQGYGSPVREWALMATQVGVGVVGGAALWLICEWLWQRLPVVALVVALAVITGLVWVVRRVRRAEDLQTTVIAVLVGLFVTVSPAALLLVGR